MIESLVSALVTLALVVVGILVALRVISLEDAAKTIGRIIVAFILILIGLCLLRQSVFAGLMALAALLKVFVKWLFVTILVAAPLTFFAWLLFWRSGRLNAKRRSHGDEQ